MRQDPSPQKPQNHRSPEARAEEILAELRETAQSLPALPDDAQDLLVQMLSEPARPVPSGLKERVRAALEIERAQLATVEALEPPTAAPQAEKAAGGGRGRLHMLGRLSAAAAAVVVALGLGLYTFQLGSERSPGDQAEHPPTQPAEASSNEEPAGHVYKEAVLGPEAPASAREGAPEPVRYGEALQSSAQPLLVELGEARILMDRGCTLKPQRDYRIELDQGRMAVVTRERLVVTSPHGTFVVAPHRGENQIGRGTAAVVLQRAVEQEAEPRIEGGKVHSFEQRMIPLERALEQCAGALGEPVRYELTEEERAATLTLPISLEMRGVELPEFVSVLEQALSLYQLDLAAPRRAGEGYVVRRHPEAATSQAVSSPAWISAEVRCGTVTLLHQRGEEGEARLEVSVAQPMDVPQVLRVLANGKAEVVEGILAERWPAVTLEAFDDALTEFRSDFTLHWPSIPEVHTQTTRPKALHALSLLTHINNDTVVARDHNTDEIRLLRVGESIHGFTVKRIGQSGVLMSGQNEQGEAVQYFQPLETE